MTISPRPRRVRAGAALLSATLVIGGTLALGAAPAAGADDDVHTQTFLSGPQTTFTIPADATSVRLIVAGDQGNTRVLGATELGGAGGTATVDLGTAYNGETLNLLVGNPGLLGGAGGSYVALEDEFLVIAGGGGSGGRVGGVTGTVLPGGTGGFATSSPDGGDGTNVPGYHHSGTGATGATPGTTGYTTAQTGGVTNGTTATIVDGVITPGIPSYDNTTEGLGGGQGYAGGAGPRDQLLAAAGGLVRAASGGGSGYLAAGLDLVSTAPNFNASGESALAYITITWTTPVADSEEPGTDEPGNDEPGNDEPGTDEGAAPSRPQDGIVLPIVAG